MLVTVSEISRRLAERAEEVCHLLLPGGKRVKGEWLVGDLTGAAGDSLHISLDGAHAGQWRDWASQEDRGDLVDLWRACRGVTAAEAIKQIKEFLGIADPYVSQRSERQYSKPAADVTKPLDPKGKAIEWLSSKRKLDPAVVNRFRIEGSQEHRAIVFPCYSPAGVLVNRSYRTLTEPKKVWQDQGCAPCLFGWQGIPDASYQSKTILLCEGQVDCMTWAQWGIPALSVPNGSGMSWIEYEWENLEAFDTIYLAFDQDPAGAEITEKAVNRLGRHRCLLVSLPTKDANAALQGGATAQDAASWIASAKATEIRGLVLADQLEQRILRDLAFKPNDCFTLPFFKGEDDYSGFYPRPGDVTIWTGDRGEGKTAFLNFLTMSLLAHSVTVFVASLEMKAERLIRKMITSYYRRTPTPEDVRTFISECGQSLLTCDQVGCISKSALLEMMKYALQRHGVSHFIIDSLMRISKLEEDYVAQTDFMNEILGFAKNSGSHVHLVAHTRKFPAGQQGRKGMGDVKGNSSIENNVDNIAIVRRNHDKQSFDDYDTEIEIKKQRETGWLGSFYLRFDHRHFAYSSVKEDNEY
jgi:twinkle protein